MANHELGKKVSAITDSLQAITGTNKPIDLHSAGVEWNTALGYEEHTARGYAIELTMGEVAVTGFIVSDDKSDEVQLSVPINGLGGDGVVVRRVFAHLADRDKRQMLEAYKEYVVSEGDRKTAAILTRRVNRGNLPAERARVSMKSHTVKAAEMAEAIDKITGGVIQLKPLNVSRNSAYPV